MGTFVSSELGQGTTGFSGEYCFGVMYGEWYGVCDYVVLSVVEVCVDYGGVHVFHYPTTQTLPIKEHLQLHASQIRQNSHPTHPLHYITTNNTQT